MAIKIVNGNIFNSKAQTIVNTVNCVGVMGKGIALVFKLRYPNMYEQYQKLCDQHLIEIGKLWIYKGEKSDPWVLNFPTKTHWKLPSEYEYIEKGLQKFVDTYKEKGITSVAFPLLGAFNGGLDKERVIEIMQSYLSRCDIPIEIYQYDPMAPGVTLALSSLIASSKAALTILIVVVVSVECAFLIISSTEAPPSHLIPPFQLISIFTLAVSPSV